MMNKLKLSGAVLAATLTLAGTVSASDFITIGTGGVTGVYYPAGGAICRLVNKDRKVHGIRCSVESTGGSVENIQSMRAGELQFGIVQSDVQAGTGTASDDDAGGDLRALFSLHSEPMHLMVRADSGIGGADGLPDKKVNIGNPGSGTRVLAEKLLTYAGISTDDLEEAAELASSEQSSALCEGEIDATFWVAGSPNGVTQEATSSCDVTIVPLSGAAVDTLLAENPAYADATIPGGMYPGNPEDIASWGPKATVVTTASMSDEVVYAMVGAVFDNLDAFRKLHPALERLTAEEMISEGLTAPLHPGALKYYQEKGWK